LGRYRGGHEHAEHAFRHGWNDVMAVFEATSSRYHLLTRNCFDFANELYEALRRLDD
jgi:hypothetical protein